MRFQHAIFDLDGTLLDTEPVYTHATQQVLDPYGKTFTWELKQRMMGQPSRTAAQLLIETLEIDLTPDQYLTRRQPLVEEGCRKAPEIAGAGTFIETLAARGLGLAIATSSPRQLCQTKLSERAWAGAFGTIVCGDDPQVKRGKPAPDIFIEAARQLGADPAATVVFEDSPTGLAAARAAGMSVVAVVDPRLDRERIGEVDEIVADYSELGPWLARLSA